MSIFSAVASGLGVVGGLISGAESVGKAFKRAVGLDSPTTKRRKASPVALPAPPALPGIGAITRFNLPGAATGVGLLDLGVPGPGIFSQTACPTGFHLSKQEPFKCVRNRRMNPLNPRAFRRSVRRIKGAVKFAKEVDKVVAIRPRPRRSSRGHHRHLHHD